MVRDVSLTAFLQPAEINSSHLTGWSEQRWPDLKWDLFPGQPFYKIEGSNLYLVSRKSWKFEFLTDHAKSPARVNFEILVGPKLGID